MNIQWVVDKKMCTQCGACVGICPSGAIDLKWDEKEGYTPIINRNCNLCGLCNKVCSGAEVDFEDLTNRFNLRKNQKDFLGGYDSCYVGWAKDEALRWQASSGGIVTALLRSAFEKKMIDGAIVTRTNPNNPLQLIPYIARSQMDLLPSIGSKYNTVPLNAILKEVIKVPGKYAFVGLPCHIHSLRKAQKCNPKLAESIVVVLGLFCGMTMPPKATRLTLSFDDIHVEGLNDVVHRGHGWPGYLIANRKNAEPFTKPYLAYYRKWFTCYSLERCGICPDGLAMLADLSFGDAWLDRYREKDTKGTSVFVVRSEKGKEFFHQVGEDIVDFQSLPTEDVLLSQQSLKIVKSDQHLPNLFIFKLLHGTAPSFIGIKVKSTKNNYMQAFFNRAKKRILMLLAETSISKRWK